MNNVHNTWNIHNIEKFMTLRRKLPVVPLFCVLYYRLYEFMF
jgi:hypothetical protein